MPFLQRKLCKNTFYESEKVKKRKLPNFIRGVRIRNLMFLKDKTLLGNTFEF
jgi:hypothetical protein